MIRESDERGISAPYIGFIAVIVALLVVIGVLIYKLDHKKSVSTVPVPKISSHPPMNLSLPKQKVTDKTYCDPVNNGCLTYPSNWSLVDHAKDENPYIQIISPTNQNITEIKYTINAQKNTVGNSSHDTVISNSKLTKGISGLIINGAIMSTINTPYFAIVDSSGSWGHTKGDNTWTVIALPTDQTFSSPTQATAWFSSSDAKTALQIIQSFYFK